MSFTNGAIIDSNTALLSDLHLFLHVCLWRVFPLHPTPPG